MMSNFPCPYLKLFTQLRDAGMALTLDQYHLLLHALILGYGQSWSDLKELCQLLWVKPKSSFDAAIFEEIFDQYQRQCQAVPVVDSPSPAPAPSVSPAPSPSTAPVPTSSAPPPSKAPESGSVQTPGAILGRRQPAIFRPRNGPRSRFSFTIRDYPVSSRRILQSCLTLRVPVSEGAGTELDLPATLAQLNTQGTFFNPVLRPRQVYRTELLLLIDWNGSMIPFHPLIHHLVDTVKQGGFRKTTVYYFRNYPENYLYLYPNHPAAQKLGEVLTHLHKNRTVVVMVSDGGAARQGYNPERVELTAKFLGQLRGKVRHISWLNPVPKSRWWGTTAEEICRLLNDQMYELTPVGLRGVMRGMRKGRAMGLSRGIDSVFDG